MKEDAALTYARAQPGPSATLEELIRIRQEVLDIAAPFQIELDGFRLNLLDYEEKSEYAPKDCRVFIHKRALGKISEHLRHIAGFPGVLKASDRQPGDYLVFNLKERTIRIIPPPAKAGA